MAETPLMQQYGKIKSQNPDILLFFRLGDFYEMFGDDAKEASQILGLALTARAGTPMCGVPYHSANTYISKLLKAGRKVAICEQTSTVADPKTKLCERKVVRIITPGTILEDAMLEANASNYLVSLQTDSNGWGLACLELSTGDFWITENTKDDSLIALADLLGSINPSEILASKEGLAKLKTKIVLPAEITLSSRTENIATDDIPQSWPTVLNDTPLALKAALACIKYVAATNAEFKEYFTPFYKEITDYLQMDASAVNTLEITASQYGGRKNTLWGVLDYTKTPMASRLLKEWLLRPLLNAQEIKQRQDCTENLMKDETARDRLALLLKDICDIERIMSRVAAGSATPRDLAGLRSSLLLTEKFEEWFKDNPELLPNLKEIFEANAQSLTEISALLFAAIDENPPLKQNDGGIIRTGYNAELDELRELKHNAGRALEDIAAREKEKTGIPTLKVGYNSVFGYYIEVSKAQAGKVPYNYVRKQTLTNGERFITDELKELEKKILSADEKSLRIELALFEEIKRYLYHKIDVLKSTAKVLAQADCFYSFAIAAINGSYIKPVILESNEALVIEKGRHPIVEQNIPAGSFVPNDTFIGGQGPQIMMITGPNMGGKSVYLKQTALITVMAQAGSFVPAQSAQIPLTDKILTRIGAQDALSLGQSTFMVEMRETAHILASATPATLVLLDEVGRGTSTFDGISIAWAIAEFLYKPNATGPKVLFATHYFELTELEAKYDKIKNFHVAVSEYKNNEGESKLNFLFEVRQGAADKSYGIHVAQIAGLPKSCILRAQKILKDLGEKDSTGIVKKEAQGPDLFSSPILEELKMVDTDTITPLQAIQILAEWKKRLQ